MCDVGEIFYRNRSTPISMPTLRIAIFNVENMLSRFAFRRFEKERLVTLLDVESEEERLSLVRTHFNVINDENRVATALAIRDTQADVVCLQEVDSMRALKAFHDRYLRRSVGVEYRHKALIEGNDPRGIDVAVMSRFKIDAATSHQELTFEELGIPPVGSQSPGDRVFRRDCLEVHVKKDGKTLPIFICHFKSMSGGRDRTRAAREAEALAVRRIIEDRFADPSRENWLIAGDLNDYTETDGVADNDHGLGALLDEGFSLSLMSRVSAPEGRWTHFYTGDRLPPA